MVSLRRPLAENIVSLACLQAINYVVPLITLPYLVRVLQPSQFGLLSFAQGIVLYFDFFTDFGFNYSATRAIACHRHEPGAVRRIFWSTLFSKVLLMALSTVALALLVAATPKLRNTASLFAANSLYLVGTTLFPIWFLQGQERMKVAVAALGIGRLLTIPAILLFVRSPHDYVNAAAIQASVELTAGLLTFPFIVRRMDLRWYRPSWVDLKETIYEAWPLFLSSSALFLSTSSTAVILGLLAGDIQVGYFSAADKLIKASIAALSPLGQALYPHIADVKRASPHSALKIIRASFFGMIALSVCISATVAIFARPVCQFFLGPSFRHSGGVLEWLSPLPLLYGLMNVLGAQTMLVFEMDAVFSRIMLTGGLAGIPVTAVFSHYLGAKGAALGSVSMAAAIVFAMFVALRSKGLHIWKDPAIGAVSLKVTPLLEPE